MTPKELMNEKRLSVLEEAAKMNTHIHYIDEVYPSEIKDIVSDMEQSFIDGAQWQREMSWKDIEKSGYPPFDKNCEIYKREKYLVRVSAGSIDRKVYYTVSFLINKCRFSVEGDWVQVTHWMPIPEFNIKT
jgi:hypothetical protein